MFMTNLIVSKQVQNTLDKLNAKAQRLAKEILEYVVDAKAYLSTSGNDIPATCLLKGPGNFSHLLVASESAKLSSMIKVANELAKSEVILSYIWIVMATHKNTKEKAVMFEGADLHGNEITIALKFYRHNNKVDFGTLQMWGEIGNKFKMNLMSRRVTSYIS